MHLMRTFCWCKNAFDAYILLVQKCIFAKQNVTNAFLRTFSKGKCSAKQNVTNAFDAKMHLMPKCILAYIFQRKMFSCAKMHLMRTFCYTKCYKCIFATHHIFQRKMFSVHFPLENVQLCKNAFDAKMHLMLPAKAAKCILATQRITFYEVKCSASHFPKENVQHHIFQRKMFSTSKM